MLRNSVIRTRWVYLVESQHAFTGGMRIASVVAGVLLVAAGIMA